MYFEPDLWSDEFRGCGRTTDQLLGAPEGAVFVCPYQEAIRHTRALAESLGRHDVEVVSRAWLLNDRWRGRKLAGVVIDHETERRASSQEREAMHCVQAAIRARG